MRFGINFLYPISRYVNGLTNNTVIGSQTLASYKNPLYSAITEPSGYAAAGLGPWVPQQSGNPRLPQDNTVFLAYIVGVPWQDIAVDPTDLTQGFKNPTQMAAPVPGQSYNSWDLIVGTPIDLESTPPPLATGQLMVGLPDGGSMPYEPPRDPHMIESVFPRTALLTNPVDPINGVPLAPPPAPGMVDNPLPDPVNGHEWTPELLPGANDAGVSDAGRTVRPAVRLHLPAPGWT